MVGNALGASDIHGSNAAAGGGSSSRSTSVSGVPTDGRLVYVRLLSQYTEAVGGGFEVRDYTFRTQNIPRTVTLMVTNRLVYPVDLYINSVSSAG